MQADVHGLSVQSSTNAGDTVSANTCFPPTTVSSASSHITSSSSCAVNVNISNSYPCHSASNTSALIPTKNRHRQSSSDINRLTANRYIRQSITTTGIKEKSNVIPISESSAVISRTSLEQLLASETRSRDETKVRTAKYMTAGRPPSSAGKYVPVHVTAPFKTNPEPVRNGRKSSSHSTVMSSAASTRCNKVDDSQSTGASESLNGAGSVCKNYTVTSAAERLIDSTKLGVRIEQRTNGGLRVPIVYNSVNDCDSKTIDLSNESTTSSLATRDCSDQMLWSVYQRAADDNDEVVDMNTRRRRLIKPHASNDEVDATNHEATESLYDEVNARFILLKQGSVYH